MSRKIKLIWDFRGPASAKTAEHHEIHLKEYIVIEKLPINITGFEILNEMYATAFMVVTEENMIQVRDALKPHRGELYEQTEDKKTDFRLEAYYSQRGYFKIISGYTSKEYRDHYKKRCSRSILLIDNLSIIISGNNI